MMLNFVIVASWISFALLIVSALCWFKASRISLPILKGIMRDIGESGIGEMSRKLNTQSLWSIRGAIFAALGVFAFAITLIGKSIISSQ